MKHKTITGKPEGALEAYLATPAGRARVAQLRNAIDTLELTYAIRDLRRLHRDWNRRRDEALSKLREQISRFAARLRAGVE